MLTAEEFLQEHPSISHFYDDNTDRMVCFDDDVKQAMIEFAKYHVKNALNAAAEIELNCDCDSCKSCKNNFPKKEVAECYNLENIK